MIKPGYLFEFVKIADGDHNDLIKNHKMIIYDKLREFLRYVTKKSYSLNLNDKQEEDINSEFFRKLHPHKGDEDLNSDRNDNDEINSNNFVIRNYIELEIYKNSDEANALQTDKSNLNLIQEKFIQIEIKEEQVPIEVDKGGNAKDEQIKESRIKIINNNQDDKKSNCNEDKE
jgi:hypothetical protein